MDLTRQACQQRELAAVAGVVEPDVGSGEFVDHYLRTTRHARAVVERVFYGY